VSYYIIYYTTCSLIDVYRYVPDILLHSIITSSINTCTTKRIAYFSPSTQVTSQHPSNPNTKNAFFSLPAPHYGRPILSSCNATAAVSGEALVMTSLDAAVPVRALEANNGKRSLRYYDTEEDDETDKYDQKNDKYDDDEEERGVMTAEQIRKWTAKADEWVELGKKPAGMKDKLTAFNGVMSEKNKEKYNLFLSAYVRANRNALDRL